MAGELSVPVLVPRELADIMTKEATTDHGQRTDLPTRNSLSSVVSPSVVGPNCSARRPAHRRMARALRRLVWAGVLFVAAAASAWAGAALASSGEVRGHVVDPAGKPVADAVVFVQELPAGVAPTGEAGTAVMDQVGKAFVPHILPVAVGTEVAFPNHDQIHHHVYSFSRTKTFEIPLYKGEAAAPVLFDKVGAVKVGCNIHDWMSAVIVVLPNRYFTTTDASGAFVLDGLPPGQYTLAAWHEGSQVKIEDTLQSVTANGTPQELTFTLPVSAPRVRPAARGMRSYE